MGKGQGTPPLDEVAAVINDKTGFECSVNEKELAEASRLVEAFSGKRVAANKPIMGSNAFTQTAGIHADGDKKASLYESPLKPERFGKERKYALGKLSGKASLEQNLEKLGIKLEKQDMKRVLERIIDLGDNKKTVTVEDLPYIISDTLDTPEERKIRIVDCTVNSGMRTKPSASLTLETGKQEYSEKAVGDGGYDAFMNALAKASKKAGLELPMLVDYEVKIPPGGKTNALVETTITWKTRKGKEFATTGVDPDQVMAAVKATEKMINHASTNGETKNSLKI